MREINLTSERKTQLVDITQQIQQALDGVNGASAVLIYVPHTTAGVTIQEHADPAVARDLEAALEQMVRTTGAGSTSRRARKTRLPTCAPRS